MYGLGLSCCELSYGTVAVPKSHEPRIPEGGRGLFGWDGFLACRIAGVVAFGG